MSCAMLLKIKAGVAAARIAGSVLASSGTGRRPERSALLTARPW
jgi:hypothetical protein